MRAAAARGTVTFGPAAASHTDAAAVLCVGVLGAQGNVQEVTSHKVERKAGYPPSSSAFGLNGSGRITVELDQGSAQLSPFQNC
jgi:hypothetical protein